MDHRVKVWKIKTPFENKQNYENKKKFNSILKKKAAEKKSLALGEKYIFG